MNTNLTTLDTVFSTPKAQQRVTYGNGDPLIFPDYTVIYPKVVLEALKKLYKEYNQAFKPLIEANREFPTDYGYCVGNGGPVNYFVQIDMLGLPSKFLDSVNTLSPETVYKTLRDGIFEIENSLAVYQFLQNLFPRKERDSFFKESFRASLDDIRRIYNMPIALLAVTDQKYEEMRQFEFGKANGEILTDKEVMEFSGFDCLLGPKEFKAHVEANHGKCHYLLYSRTSDPLEKLKKPDFEIYHPLLSNPIFRKIIKAYSLTINIDDPSANYASKINDTKEYMPAMNMGYVVSSQEDIFSKDFIDYLMKEGSNIFDKVNIRIIRLNTKLYVGGGVVIFLISLVYFNRGKVNEFFRRRKINKILT